MSTSPEFMDAARLALADADRDGHAIPVDTMMLAQVSNSAAPALGVAQRLVANERLVGVVGHSNSSASLAASQVYNARRVVQIAPQTSAVVYSDAGAYSYRLVPPDDRQGRFLADHLTERFPAGTRVAAVYVNDDYGRGLRLAVRGALVDRAVHNVLELPYSEDDVGEADIEHAGDAIRAASPDVILWLGRGSTLERFLPTLRAAAPSAAWLGADGLATARQLMTHDGRWAGIVHVDFFDLEATPELRAFAASYEARFGRPATTSDALTYDAVRLMLAAIDHGARSGPALRDYLDSLGRTRPAFEGITGPIEFDENGDVVRGYVLTRLP